MNAIGQYLLSLCRRKYLSMREASLLAGLSTETIATIIRREGTPRPETLRALADALDGDFDYMMRLAGHLPELPSSHFDELGAEAQLQLDHLIDLWKAVKALDPGSLGRLMQMARMQAEMVSAALRARESEREDERVPNPENHSL